MKKTIVASKELNINHIISNDDIDFKSPGGELECYDSDKIIGKKLIKNILKDQPLSFSDIEES